MIGRIFVAAALLAASASIPAQAQEARSKGSDYANKKICKLEGRNGSRLGGKRTCKSQAEWDQIARESRLTAEAIQRGPQPCLMGGNDPTRSTAPNCGN
jgi:phage tail sheath protein FI